jgi:hypothetical protein
LLLAVKYENDDRNKAIFTMTWDANGRPHEIKKIRVNQVSLGDNYGEGEIPVNTKTGSRDFNIAASYAYIRNYLNELPLKNEPNAFLFQSHKNGAPLHSDTMTALFKDLRKHIIALLDNNKITDQEERGKLQAIVSNKIWNMYCLRHSALTDKFDVLDRGELVQIAGWSPNTKQDKRYIKSRVSRNTKKKLLHQAGIITKEEAEPEPRTNICPCGYANTHGSLRCVKCNFALGYRGWKTTKQNLPVIVITLSKEQMVYNSTYNICHQLRKNGFIKNFLYDLFASYISQIQNATINGIER